MEHKYDVAISFLSADEGLARELRDLLSPNLSVFLYTHRQVEIAGTDGLVTFRKTFRDETRLVVVLFRNGWGDTQWTRVEAEAITDRFLKEGSAFLFFVMIDSASVPPAWVPEKKIRFNLEDFGVEQAAGAIKLRIQELGGVLKKETIAERAQRLEERERFKTETEMLRRDSRGVEEVRQQGLAFVAVVQGLAQEVVQAAPRLDFDCRAESTAVGIRSHKASVYAELRVPYINTLNDAVLIVRVLPGNIILPGEQRMYLNQPKITKEERYTPDRSLALGWCWRGTTGQLSSSSVLAERVMQLLIAAIEDTK